MSIRGSAVLIVVSARVVWLRLGRLHDLGCVQIEECPSPLLLLRLVLELKVELRQFLYREAQAKARLF